MNITEKEKTETPVSGVAIENIIDYKGHGEFFTLVTTSNGLEFPIDQEQAEILHKQSNTFTSMKAYFWLRQVEQKLIK